MREFSACKSTMVSLKFEGMWVPASGLEMSEGPGKQPCLWGLKRPWREVPGKTTGANPTPYPSLQRSEGIEAELGGTCNFL